VLATQATGMLVMAASSVLFSVVGVFVPLAAPANSSIIAAARFVVGIVSIVGFSFIGLGRLTTVNRWWLVLRGVIGGLSVYLYYRGIAKLGLGTGTILNYSYPVFAALLAPLLVKERLTWDVVAAVIVSFGGIWLVVSPSVLQGGNAAGGLPLGLETAFALLGGILAGVAVVAIKKLRETDSPQIIYLAQCFFGLLIVGWPAATSSFSFGAVTWVILLGIGGLATVAQLMMTWAYKHVPATEGSLLGFLVPVISVGLGAAVFGERMRAASLAGSAIVLLCCGYVAFRERIWRLVG